MLNSSLVRFLVASFSALFIKQEIFLLDNRENFHNCRVDEKAKL